MAALRDALKEPFPEGWYPELGETVIVPARKSAGGFRGRVVKRCGDIITVCVFWYRGNNRVEYLLHELRPWNSETA